MSVRNFPGVYNHYTDESASFKVTPAKASANFGVGAISLLNPVVGILYGGTELLYPGGAAQALTDSGDLAEKNQKILGPTFRLNGYGGN